MSETMNSVVDLMKRYQHTTITPVENVLPCPLDYSPDANTIAGQLIGCFLFSRGGVSYKIQSLVHPVAPTSPAVSATFTPATYRASADHGTADFIPASYARGQASIQWQDPGTVWEFSIPWTNDLPYQFTDFTNPEYANFDVSNNGIPLSPAYPNVDTWLAVRDDFQVGFLVAPTPLESAPRPRKPRCIPPRKRFVESKLKLPPHPRQSFPPEPRPIRAEKESKQEVEKFALLEIK